MSLYNDLYNIVLHHFFEDDNSNGKQANTLIMLLANELRISSPGTILDSIATVLQREVESDTLRGDLLLNTLFELDAFEYTKDAIKSRKGKLVSVNGKAVYAECDDVYVPVYKGFVLDVLNSKGATCRVDNVTVSVLGSDLLVEGAYRECSSTTEWSNFYGIFQYIIEEVIRKCYEPTVLTRPSPLHITARNNTSIKSSPKAELDFDSAYAMVLAQPNSKFVVDALSSATLGIDGTALCYEELLGNAERIERYDFNSFKTKNELTFSQLQKSVVKLKTMLSKKFMDVFVSNGKEITSWISGDNSITVTSEKQGNAALVNIRSYTKEARFALNKESQEVYCLVDKYEDFKNILYSILIQMS